jgi:aspartyl-tRNA(Asn)/glutamyl-tRNA(Gln) amidotransferase subunit C
VKLTDQEVRYVADLANLNLTADEVGKMRADLESILGYMDKLNEVDTTGVAPMTQVLYPAEETATLRRDRERAPLGAEAALANAPQAGAGYFKIPKVIER